jgi:hypothetical protein
VINLGLGAAAANRWQSLALLPLAAAFQPLAQFLGRLAFQGQLDQALRIDGARGARWRRRSVSPSGGFTSCGSMYLTWSMSWLA